MHVLIRIADFTFNYATEVSISHAWSEQTSTCTITLPRNLRLQQQELKTLIKRGDKVTVQLGYDGKLREEFRGYVARVKNTTPLEIECEDEMFQLKRYTITKTWSNTTLSQMAKDLYPGQSKCFDAEIGSFSASKTTPALVLDQIKSDYSLKSFFRKGVLIIGLPYDKATATEHKFKIQFNVIDNNDLEFRRKDDYKIKVSAISILPSNQKIQIELGDKDGDERTLHFYNLQKPALEKMAKQEMERIKYDGFTGSFTAFGIPPVEMGDIVELTDERYQDNSGRYWVDKVEKTFGQSGFRRKITLGPQAA